MESILFSGCDNLLLDALVNWTDRLSAEYISSETIINLPFHCTHETCAYNARFRASVS